MPGRRVGCGGSAIVPGPPLSGCMKIIAWFGVGGKGRANPLLPGCCGAGTTGCRTGRQQVAQPPGSSWNRAVQQGLVLRRGLTPPAGDQGAGSPRPYQASAVPGACRRSGAPHFHMSGDIVHYKTVKQSNSRVGPLVGVMKR